jgi:cell division protein FtsZ
MRRALEGLEELKKHLDTVIVVPNQNLFKIANEATTFEESFSLSNDVLKHGVQSVTDLMVRPGMINLDFADVETVMSAMGKAMMGTGEAEGENRATIATEMALNNPLIDEYSLKGAKGLLVNITGGKDITLFEVDQSVNKIRTEVDPEAELIFGAIKDDDMDGKIRVSIVATSLDGYKPESKTVLNMVNRIQNRNTGYSENIFKNTNINQNTIGSIEGATALKLDAQLEVKSSAVNLENMGLSKSVSENLNQAQDSSPEGISIENASYIENNLDVESQLNKIAFQEEHTPQLFSEENKVSVEDNSSLEDGNIHSDNLFDKSSTDEEDFEIPAFLRKQKF